MTTAISERPAATKTIVLSVTDETIASMASRMMSLKVNGIADKKGYELVDTARKECVKARTGIEKVHKELKAESLKYCQELDAEKRRLTGKVEAIENHLKSELEAVEREQARIQKAKDDAIYADRVAKLAEVNTVAPENYIRAMSNSDFDKYLADTIEVQNEKKLRQIQAAAEEAERKRIAAEEAEANRKESLRLAAERAEFERQRAEQEAERKRLQEIEDQRLAKERAELEAQRQEQARQAAELKAEQDRLARIEADRQQAIEQQRVAAEAAERSRLETEERLKREAEVAEQERIAREAAEKRSMELRPAKQKLNLFAHSLIELEIPNISDLVNSQVQAVLNQAAESIRRIGANLS